MSEALALKYRPKTWDDVTEQEAVKTILENQINTDTIKHGYLFCGGAGTGKTTCARIFANSINKGNGSPIELDAASNNSVDDIRTLIEDAQTKSLYSEYKVFILDEVHALSGSAWQAMLKTLEEPPAKSIFILCTTNPEKIPATILSRVQRYNFQRISQKGVIERLKYIVDTEGIDCSSLEPLNYIAKIADGGMRDAITLLDKCVSYNPTLTMNSVIEALGVVDYGDMLSLLDEIIHTSTKEMINHIEKIYMSGKDLKLFVKDFFEFILDLNVYNVTHELSNTKIPQMWKKKIDDSHYECEKLISLLDDLLKLQSEIKWEHNPKPLIIANFILWMEA